MRNKFIRYFIFAWVIIGGTYAAYIAFQPHRDVVNATAEESLQVKDFVTEYLLDQKAANLKYLSSDGDSKILLLEGSIEKLSTSGDGRSIILLSDDSTPVGVQCLFAEGESSNKIEPGTRIKIKGVLRAGPAYDDDLEMYENAYLEECVEVD